MKIENLVCAQFANIIHESGCEILSYIDNEVTIDNVTLDVLEAIEDLQEDLGISSIDVTKKSLTRYLITLS